MPLDDIISLVKHEWKQALLEFPFELSVMVEIIFGQCYGHLHSHANYDRFIVTALTKPDSQRTVSELNYQGAEGWVNRNLSDYAEGPLRQNVQEMEAWRNEPANFTTEDLPPPTEVKDIDSFSSLPNCSWKHQPALLNVSYNIVYKK